MNKAKDSLMNHTPSVSSGAGSSLNSELRVVLKKLDISGMQRIQDISDCSRAITPDEASEAFPLPLENCDHQNMVVHSDDYSTGIDDALFSFEEAKEAYMSGEKIMHKAKLSFEDLLRAFVVESKTPLMHITFFLTMLKRYKPYVNFDDLPWTGRTLMRTNVSDRLGTEIHQIYEENGTSSQADEADEDAASSCASIGTENSENQDPMDLVSTHPNEPSSIRNKVVTGKYVHFGLDRGVFGDSIGFTHIFHQTT